MIKFSVHEIIISVNKTKSKYKFRHTPYQDWWKLNPFWTRVLARSKLMVIRLYYKTIIPFALVVYTWYTTRAHGIIVRYMLSWYMDLWSANQKIYATHLGLRTGIKVEYYLWTSVKLWTSLSNWALANLKSTTRNVAWYMYCIWIYKKVHL